MHLLLFGGFLGSGKTTVINRVLRGMSAEGFAAAVVENEIGAVGIDDALISQTGVQVTPLFGGCVCCQIAGDLLTAVEKIEVQLAPDFLVVEMTGLALMDEIREVFARYGRPGLMLHTISVVDIARWSKLVRAMEPMVRHQLAGADLVLVNKVDVVPAGAREMEQISQLAGGAPCHGLSARLEADTAVWSLVQEALL